MNARPRIRMAVIGLIGAVAVASAAYATSSDHPVPGLYKVSSTVAGQTTKIRQECLSPRDIAEAFALPQVGSCTATKTLAAGGRIDLAQTCRAGARALSGSLAGTYTRTSYQLHMISRAPELPAPLDVRLTAQRIGDCTDD